MLPDRQTIVGVGLKRQFYAAAVISVLADNLQGVERHGVTPLRDTMHWSRP
jgi:hypothetical protein